METIQDRQKLNIDLNNLRNAIDEEYTRVVCEKDHVIHFISGLPLARRLEYPGEVLDQLPEEAIRPFAGVGNPFLVAHPKPGEKILDIGSGAGMDSLAASLYTNHQSSVYGLDMTQAMIDQARQNAGRMGLNKVFFFLGHAEETPFQTGSFDLVISNGVINLIVDKQQVYNEIYRILKPGGRFQIADVLLDQPVPVESRNLVHLWTNCVAGGIPVPEYLDLINEAGFQEIKIWQQFDVFRDARVAKSAAYFGARGYNISGRKPS